jgi:hypothetical protein
MITCQFNQEKPRKEVIFFMSERKNPSAYQGTTQENCGEWKNENRRLSRLPIK